MPDAPTTREALLADLTSRDPQRIWSAAWAVIRTRDADTLAFLGARKDAITQATAGIDLGGMISSNRKSLELALRKLDFVAAGEGCLCALYPQHERIDPAREQDAGHVTIVGKTVVPYASRFTCACVACGRRYDVQEGEDHATWWEWRPSAANVRKP